MVIFPGRPIELGNSVYITKQEHELLVMCTKENPYIILGVAANILNKQEELT
jgi:hypothetical protein